MSSSSTKQRGRCSNPLLHTPTFMTGAEMFVLQQSAKHYLLIEQTRMLSPHEQQEFEKVKELLRPSLLRYTQRLTTQSAHESSAQNSHSSSSKPQGGRTKPTAQHEVRAATLPTQSKTKSAAMGSSERTVMTTNKPLGTSKINSTLTGTQSNTDTRGSAKKGSKKRPKMDIYQDSENAPTKRSRQRRQTDLDDPDKENRDPLDPFSCRPKQNVLGDATNRSNNTTMGSDIKGKNVIRNSSSNKTDTQTTTPVSSKPKADARERSSVDQTSTITTTKRQPKRAKLDSTRELPSTMGTKSSLGVDAPSSKVVGGSKEPRVAPSPVLALTGGSTRHVQGKPTVAKQRSGAKELPKEQKPAIQEHMYTAETRSVDAKPTTVIPASVEEDSGSSFALTLDVHQSVPPMPSKHKAKYEVVQDSEESEDQDSISGSQEKTFPMPEFLLSDVPEDPLEEPTFPAPEFLLDDDPQDPLEEPTFPAPEFLLDDDPQDPPEDLTLPAPEFLSSQFAESQDEEQGVSEAILDTSITTNVQSEDIQDESAFESTYFADGVWCIDDYKNGVISTVCGHGKNWIAVETTSHVQFWKLDARDNLPRTKWRRHIQLDKTSTHPIQIVFAPDDAFAVVLEARSYVKVTLRALQVEEEFTPHCSTYSWSGVNPSMTCGSLIMDQKHSQDDFTTTAVRKYQLVFGTDEPGSICLVPIPDSDEATTTNLPIQKLCYTEANERALSVTGVSNASSLVLASFETTLVLWNLNDTSSPVSVSHVPGFTSPLPSASPLVPSIVSATVPTQFFKEYKDILRSDSLPMSEWPIFIVLEMCDIEVEDDHKCDKSERCALYVMKGNDIELVHKYQGSDSISFASTSSRYVSCQAKRDGKDALYLWDISKPEAVIQLSLQGLPSMQAHNVSVVSQETVDHSKRVVDCSDHTFSDVSTLSSPPGDSMSSLRAPSSEKSSVSSTNTQGISGQVYSDRHGRAQSANHQTRRPMEWIDLKSVTWTEHSKVRFSVQAKQHWVVIVQQDLNRKHPSAIHIMDFMSLLSLRRT